MRQKSSPLTRCPALVLVRCVEALAAMLLFAARFVPESVASLLARPIGRLIRVHKRDRILSAVRLMLGGEETAATERAGGFWRAHVTHLGLNVIEPLYFYHLPDDKLLARVPIVGEEHLSRALAQGRGVVLFLNHLGNPGAIVAGLGLRGYDVTIAGNAMIATVGGHTIALGRLERIVQRMFARGHVKRALLGDRLPQRAAETLARNGLFAMFIDFPVGEKHNQPVAIGNARMNVNVGPAILALRQKAVVLGVTCVRTGPRCHQLTIHPPLEPAPGENGTPAARLLEAAMGQLLPELRAHPDQWWPWDWARILPRQ